MCSGVGYLVKTPIRDEGIDGEEVEFFIFTQVKEDAINLFGFKSKKDEEIFRMLVSVSGVGPKTAIAILDKYEASRITRAIEEADTNLFLGVSGLGKKSAMKIIIELKNKVNSIRELDLNDENTDLFDALLSLGYKKGDVAKMTKKVDRGQSLENQIKEALKYA